MEYDHLQGRSPHNFFTDCMLSQQDFAKLSVFTPPDHAVDVCLYLSASSHKVAAAEGHLATVDTRLISLYKSMQHIIIILIFLLYCRALCIL